MTNAINNSRDWLLIANGTPLSQAKLLELAQNKNVLVLDGAYEYCNQAGLNINVLLGDFDSINAEILEKISNTHIKIVHAPDQSKTDLEKGLHYIDATNATNVYICAATGRRLQHTLYNLRILKKYHRPERSMILISDAEIIRFYRDTEIKISGHIKDCIAVLGFPHAVITTTGLKYDVTDYPLQFEQYNNISNELVASEASIKISGDALVIHEVVE